MHSVPPGFIYHCLCLHCLALAASLFLMAQKSLLKGAPNMNTLVGLGPLSSFTVSSFAALLPKLEGILNRELKSKHALVNNGGTEFGSVVEVPSDSLSVGDQIVVLPGDRIPADGIVRAGRSTVDESSFIGEPLLVTKLPGSEVAAGSINLNGSLTMEVQGPGGETAMRDIVRLVKEARSREAPVQQLADKVAGHFTCAMMAVSVATLTFWSLFGSRIVPASLYQGNAVSLALQLACSVLVVACPCALGLATPTAVLGLSGVKPDEKKKFINELQIDQNAVAMNQ